MSKVTNFEPQYGGQQEQPGNYPPAPQQGDRGQPEYGQPAQGYGPQQGGYGSPPGGHGSPQGVYSPPQGVYGPPPYGNQRGTNTMAILAIVFAFVFAPLGVVFGIIARNQIRTSGEEGGGLALAGIIVGSIFTVLFVLYIIFVFVALSSAVSTFNTVPTPS